jgi:nitrite reductase/ring-hydroxylating ferredoxin subunit
VKDERLLQIEEQPTRRDFCATACQALSLLTVGAVVQGCGGGSGGGGGGGNPSGPSPAPSLRAVTGTVSGNTVLVTVDAASPLASVGGVATVTAGGNNFLVARTAAGTFSALTTTCTHEACTINGYSAPVFQCPCHGSQFSTEGAVVRGPATSALRRYSTSFAGDMLTITL